VRQHPRTPIRPFLIALGSWLVVLQLPLLGALPRPAGYVNDFAAVVADADEAYLENFLQTLERETSAEVAVATVGSLEGMTIEEYASRLFAEWGIGKRQHDNGVLLLVAPHDRTVRIEVGYGLEAILPDGLAGEIIRTEIIPEFSAGNFPRGIGRGLNQIAQIVRRGTAAVLPGAASAARDGHPPAIIVIPFFGLFIVMAAFVTGLAIRTRTFGPLLWSGMFAGIPLVIATQFASVRWVAGLAFLGLLVIPAGYRSGRSAYWRGMLRTGTPGSVPDDEAVAWVMGGRSDSSGNDASSDGAGSSSSADFGGGSSGGGGASGRW
jgi:uncharacterized protein